MNKFLTASEIQQVQELPYEDVEVPEWGGKVRIIGLDAKSAQEISSRLVTLDENGKIANVHINTIMTDLLVRTIAGQDGKPLFKLEDAAALGKKSAKVMRRLFEIAQRLSGITEPEQKAILKNSEGTSVDDSPSG